MPSHDWRAIDPLHGQMSVFRAIENGVSLFRQADQGLSIATDPYGWVLAMEDHFTSSEWVMVAQVPIQGCLHPLLCRRRPVRLAGCGRVCDHR